MAQFKPYRILESELDSLPIKDGQFIITTDTNKIFCDTQNLDRIEMSYNDYIFVQSEDNVTNMIIPKNTTLTNGYEITLPIEYIVGNNSLSLYLNGNRLIKATDSSDGHYKEVGEINSKSNKITINRTETDGNYTLEEDAILVVVVRNLKGITPQSKSSLLKEIVPKNAWSHNSIYRGENITDLFYNGTLSQQIAAETFDDIFIGDYIIGQESGRKYVVADINYRINTGDTIKCTTPHILMIPESYMSAASMNDTNTTEGGYVGSKMRTTTLFSVIKPIIVNDFGSNHILQHRNFLSNTVSSIGFESSGTWYDSDIELMNEIMVYGSNIFHNVACGTYIPENYTIDKTQLSLFRYNRKILNQGASIWLRDIVSTTHFANVDWNGVSYTSIASMELGILPTFLVY